MFEKLGSRLTAANRPNHAQSQIQKVAAITRPYSRGEPHTNVNALLTYDT